MKIMMVDKHQRKEQRGDRIDGAFFSVGVVAPLDSGKCVVYMRIMMVDKHQRRHQKK
jgi:hypothetical protein